MDPVAATEFLRRAGGAMALIAVTALGTGVPVAAADPVPLRICANESLGHPEGDNTAYVLARTAFKAVTDLRPQFAALPWQRCLAEAARGSFDAVLSASYTVDRAQHLAYPLDASNQPDTQRRMFQVGYVLFKRKDSPIQWDGRQFTGTSQRPGEAIGAERGYSIVQFARDHGAVVEDRYPQFGSLADSLKLRRIAGLLINQEGAAMLLADPAWAKNHEISGPPIQQRAYYLPVTHAFAAAHPQLTQRLWDALAKARQSPSFQRQFSLGLSGGRKRDIQP